MSGIWTWEERKVNDKWEIAVYKGEGWKCRMQIGAKKSATEIVTACNEAPKLKEARRLLEIAKREMIPPMDNYYLIEEIAKFLEDTP